MGTGKGDGAWGRLKQGPGSQSLASDPSSRALGLILICPYSTHGSFTLARPASPNRLLRRWPTALLPTRLPMLFFLPGVQAAPPSERTNLSGVVEALLETARAHSAGPEGFARSVAGQLLEAYLNVGGGGLT